MSQIYQVNYTRDGIVGQSEFQAVWKRYPGSCGRPAGDLGIPIACELRYQGAHEHPLTGSGFASDAFSDCCDNKSNNTLWVTWHGCGSYCYTDNTALAESFDKCVEDAAKAKADELVQGGLPVPHNYTSDKFGSPCEWIDYEMLKKGIDWSRKASAANSFVTATVALLLAGLVAVAS